MRPKSDKYVRLLRLSSQQPVTHRQLPPNCGMPLTFALQALLARHEAFVLDAEDERRRMSASIGKLEEEKKDLETANARTIQDNRALLDQLEEMNSSVASSDAQIQALTATLQSTRNEIERLTVLAARATDLESQMSTMESEQASFQEELSSKQEDHRSAVQRWRNAERTIGQLQEQVDRIEREAMNERQRHVEVVSKMWSICFSSWKSLTP